MTIGEFVKCVRDDYRRIYDEEHADIDSQGTEIQRVCPHMLNRATTDGRYGIWGHDIEDLVLEGVHYTDGIFNLSIGS